MSHGGAPSYGVPLGQQAPDQYQYYHQQPQQFAGQPHVPYQVQQTPTSPPPQQHQNLNQASLVSPMSNIDLGNTVPAPLRVQRKLITGRFPSQTMQAPPFPPTPQTPQSQYLPYRPAGVVSPPTPAATPYHGSGYQPPHQVQHPHGFSAPQAPQTQQWQAFQPPAGSVNPQAPGPEVYEMSAFTEVHPPVAHQSNSTGWTEHQNPVQPSAGFVAELMGSEPSGTSVSSSQTLAQPAPAVHPDQKQQQIVSQTSSTFATPDSEGLIVVQKPTSDYGFPGQQGQPQLGHGSRPSQSGPQSATPTHSQPFSSPSPSQYSHTTSSPSMGYNKMTSHQQQQQPAPVSQTTPGMQQPLPLQPTGHGSPATYQTPSAVPHQPQQGNVQQGHPNAWSPQAAGQPQPQPQPQAPQYQQQPAPNQPGQPAQGVQYQQQQQQQHQQQQHQQQQQQQQQHQHQQQQQHQQQYQPHHTPNQVQAAQYHQQPPPNQPVQAAQNPQYPQAGTPHPGVQYAPSNANNSPGSAYPQHGAPQVQGMLGHQQTLAMANRPHAHHSSTFPGAYPPAPQPPTSQPQQHPSYSPAAFPPNPSTFVNQAAPSSTYGGPSSIPATQPLATSHHYGPGPAQGQNTHHGYGPQSGLKPSNSMSGRTSSMFSKDKRDAVEKWSKKTASKLGEVIKDAATSAQAAAVKASNQKPRPGSVYGARPPNRPQSGYYGPPQGQAAGQYQNPQGQQNYGEQANPQQQRPPGNWNQQQQGTPLQAQGQGPPQQGNNQPGQWTPSPASAPATPQAGWPQQQQQQGQQQGPPAGQGGQQQGWNQAAAPPGQMPPPTGAPQGSQQQNWAQQGQTQGQPQQAQQQWNNGQQTQQWNPQSANIQQPQQPPTNPQGQNWQAGPAPAAATQQNTPVQYGAQPMQPRSQWNAAAPQQQGPGTGPPVQGQGPPPAQGSPQQQQQQYPPQEGHPVQQQGQPSQVPPQGQQWNPNSSPQTANAQPPPPAQSPPVQQQQQPPWSPQSQPQSPIGTQPPPPPMQNMTSPLQPGQNQQHQPMPIPVPVPVPMPSLTSPQTNTHPQFPAPESTQIYQGVTVEARPSTSVLPPGVLPSPPPPPPGQPPQQQQRQGGPPTRGAPRGRGNFRGRGGPPRGGMTRGVGRGGPQMRGRGGYGPMRGGRGGMPRGGAANVKAPVPVTSPGGMKGLFKNPKFLAASGIAATATLSALTGAYVPIRMPGASQVPGGAALGRVLAVAAGGEDDGGDYEDGDDGGDYSGDAGGGEDYSAGDAGGGGEYGGGDGGGEYSGGVEEGGFWGGEGGEGGEGGGNETTTYDISVTWNEEGGGEGEYWGGEGEGEYWGGEEGGGGGEEYYDDGTGTYDEAYDEAYNAAYEGVYDAWDPTAYQESAVQSQEEMLNSLIEQQESTLDMIAGAQADAQMEANAISSVMMSEVGQDYVYDTSGTYDVAVANAAANAEIVAQGQQNALALI